MQKVANNQNGKGDKARNNYSKQFRDNYSEIDWGKGKPCYICGSLPYKPTSAKSFCSRCGNQP